MRKKNEDGGDVIPFRTKKPKAPEELTFVKISNASRRKLKAFASKKGWSLPAALDYLIENAS